MSEQAKHFLRRLMLVFVLTCVAGAISAALRLPEWAMLPMLVVILFTIQMAIAKRDAKLKG